MTAKTFSKINTVYVLTLSMVLLCISGCGTDSDSDKLFDSGSINAEETFSYTFDEEGTVEYFCEIHAPDMQGEVTVSSSAQTSGRDTVEMINGQFEPSQVSVAPGTEIVWINRDNSSHTVVEGNPSTGSSGGSIY